MTHRPPAGSATPARYLIVNADDFGQCRGINRGVIRAFERGLVTSASLMVRWPAAAEAADYARAHPRLSLGLHLDLGEWIYQDDSWRPRYEVVETDDREAVGAELDRQLTAFRRLTGRNPTHLDSHQHAHRSEPVGSLVLAIAAELGIPVRERSDRVRYCGAFYGQSGKGDPYPEGITGDAFRTILDGLPAGYTELGCHPGLEVEAGTGYRVERAHEVAVLCHPSTRAALDEAGIFLRSFHDLAG